MSLQTFPEDKIYRFQSDVGGRAFQAVGAHTEKDLPPTVVFLKRGTRKKLAEKERRERSG